MPPHPGSSRNGGSAPSSPPIDPTKNVLDLVAAESRYRDAMRIADEKLQDAKHHLSSELRLAEQRRLTELSVHKRRQMVELEKLQDNKHHFAALLRDAEGRLSSALREAERRRQDDLDTARNAYEGRQAEILRMQVKDNAAVLSQQIDKITTILSERISKLEQFRYESSGKGLGAAAVISYIIAAAGLASTIVVLAVKFKAGGG